MTVQQEIDERDWHPTTKCTAHGMRLALCVDGHYRCMFCTNDRLLRLAFVKKGQVLNEPAVGSISDVG